MARARPGPDCGAPLPWLADQCPACGAGLPRRLPWYVYLLGAVLVVLVFLGFGDIGALIDGFERLRAAWQG
jgi:hypothetical protein